MNRPPRADRIRRRVLVHGDVQGVFFRDSVRRRAEELGVAGWVDNRDDGSVEAVLEGEPDDVRALIEFCSAGPPDARVSDVEVSEQQPSGLEGFVAR